MGWRELLDSVGEGARTARSYISPWQYLSATDVASMAPGGGLVNAWQDSGRGWQNLKAGNWGQAAIDYGNMGLNLASEMGPLAKLAIFAGPSAKTANLAELQRAKTLTERGIEPWTVHHQTGWFQGGDGKWRFEIADDAARYVGSDKAPSMPSRLEIAQQYFEQQGVPKTKFATGQFPDLDQAALAYADNHIASARDAAMTQPLKDVLDHKALYEAYPQLAEMPTARETFSNVGGTYRDGRITYGGGSIAQASDPRSVLLHEVQHPIQRIEGFETGGSPAGMAREFGPQVQAEAEAYVRMFPEHSRVRTRLESEGLQPGEWDEMARRVYQRLAGEVEPRNVQTRADMTPAERRVKPPWETEDVPRDQQIFRNR